MVEKDIIFVWNFHIIKYMLYFIMFFFYKDFILKIF